MKEGHYLYVHQVAVLICREFHADPFSRCFWRNDEMDILKSEDVQIDRLVGHGGIFKTPEVDSGF